MMTRKKIENIIAYVGGVPAIFLVFIVLFNSYKKKESLRENVEYTIGVVLDIRDGMKGNKYADYEFMVEGKRYTGSEYYSPGNDLISIGDSCAIVYDKTDPSNNSRKLKYYLEKIRKGKTD